MSRPDVLVLGGGLIGLACARELSRLGRRVEVLERGRIGKGVSASWASAGMLAPLFDAPVPSPYLTACLEARDQWREWAAELVEASRLDLDYDTSGALVLDDPEAPALAELVRAVRALGEPAEPLDEAELRRRLPGLGPAPCGGVLLPGEHRVDNRKAVLALAEVLRAETPVLHEGHEVLQVELRPDEVLVRGKSFSRSAPRLLVAAGAAAGAIPGLPTLPVRPVRGQMLCLDDVRQPWTGSIRWGETYAVARHRDRLLVGSTLEEGDLVARPTPDGIAGILRRFAERFPGLGDRPIHSVWAGLRPGSPDEQPILGPDPREPRIWWAAGHYRNGILLAPWTASRIGAAWTGDTAPLAPFSPARFALPAPTL